VYRAAITIICEDNGLDIVLYMLGGWGITHPAWTKEIFFDAEQNRLDIVIHARKAEFLGHFVQELQETALVQKVVCAELRKVSVDGQETILIPSAVILSLPKGEE
jgi:hypothetical protein